MTPETFRQVQQLFQSALALPPDRRAAFVNAEAGDAEIRTEVLSLLEHHVEMTVFERNGDTNSGAATHDMISTVNDQEDAEGPVELRKRFSLATAMLLRSRLEWATVLISGIMVFVTIMAAFFGTIAVPRLIERGVALLVLGWIFIHLRRKPTLPWNQLRWLELLVITFPLIDICLIIWFRSSSYLRSQSYEEIEELRAIASTAVVVYIGVYGMFIPSNWRRTAIVTGAMAAIPTVISVAHRLAAEYPEGFSYMHFANPTLTFVMAVVATVGAGLVHNVRRLAEAARYYGNYRLTEEIGRGGMGVIYRAEHERLKRPAAIKLIRRESAGSAAAIAQFEKEVQAAATLSHHNTVQIYDYGTTEGGDFFCVMEHLDGETLRDRLIASTTIPLAETTRIISQLCNALHEAHARSLVHRDIKPANIFLANIGGVSDVVKLLDFGLVVSTTDRNAEQGQITGTPSYMSPEQLRGEAVDGRTDIYAIGCVMFECLVGYPPFRARNLQELIAFQLMEPPDLKPIDRQFPQLSPVLKRCLGKFPNERLASVDELRRAIEPFAAPADLAPAASTARE